MGVDPGLAELLKEMREISDSFGTADDVRNKRLDAIEKSVNELFIRANRPGREGANDNNNPERKDAVDLCILKHDLAVPKVDPSQPAYMPSHDEISAALSARRGLKNLFRTGNFDRLDPEYRKSLSYFSFGTNSFFVTPEMSNRVLSCLVDPTDVAGLMGQAFTSSGSLKFLIDSARMADAAWACDASCFSNNPQPDLQDGLGEMEIKAETLRFIVCAGNDLLQDASFDIEAWVLRTASDGFRRTINNAIIVGDGLSKPLGIINPSGGVPVCDTAPSTPPGQFTWQDLVMLAMEIPAQWQAGGSFLMNQRTLALLWTMSTADGRPLWGQSPGDRPGFTFAGWPINIVSQMPDVAPGATPVAFGNWREAYMVVNRKATTVIVDPYSAGFCTLMKFDARIGGAPTCPNAARLLRIR